MVDPKPLLKMFGSGVDAIAQIATDKAVNARRQTSTTSGINAANARRAGGVNISEGELIVDVALEIGNENEVPHSLGREAFGALVIKNSNAFVAVCVGTSASSVTMDAVGSTTVTLWVF